MDGRTLRSYSKPWKRRDKRHLQLVGLMPNAPHAQARLGINAVREPISYFKKRTREKGLGI